MAHPPTDRWKVSRGLIALSVVAGVLAPGPGATGRPAPPLEEAGAETSPGPVPGDEGSLPPGGPRPAVEWSVRTGVSPPLRRLAPSPDRGGPPPDEVPLGRREHPGTAVPEGGEAGAADGGGAPAPAGGAIPDPEITFDGVSNTHNEALVGRMILPPDVNGDVGPDHYVQTTNVVFAVFDKEGNIVEGGGPFPNRVLWSGLGGPCEERDDGDPIVLYDHLADRWLFSQFAFTDRDDSGPRGPFYQCVAVSKTGDPVGEWHQYAFRWSRRKLNDYPKLGVWPDGYYLSVNQFDRFDLFAGVGVAVFERSQMLAGEPARVVRFDLEQDQPHLFGFLPADLDGDPPPPGVPNPFLQLDDPAFGAPRSRLQVWELDVRWRRPHRSTFRRVQRVRVPGFDSLLCDAHPHCVSQPDAAPMVDAITDRLMYRLQYRNFGTHETLVVNHTVDAGGGRAAVRWYELRRLSAAWSLRQRGTWAPDDGATDHHRWMGSVAMDRAGNIALGYSVSSGVLYPSIRYAGRLAADPRGELSQGEAELHAGGGSQMDDVPRWGDYTMMAVDPDGCTFWYTNEYYATTSERAWQTRVGAFRLAPCPDGDAPADQGVTAPAARFQTRRSFAVAWDASADGGSGVAGYIVERRAARLRKAWGRWKPWHHGSEAVLDARHRGSPGRAYCFRSRAFDNAGNRSSAGPSTCTTLPVDDRGLVQAGPWTERTARGHYLGTFTRTAARGASLRLENVPARHLALVATVCPRCGTVQASWNGQPLKRVDLARPHRRTRRVFHLADLGAVRRGTLELLVVSRGRPVLIDGAGAARV